MNMCWGSPDNNLTILGELVSIDCQFGYRCYIDDFEECYTQYGVLGAQCPDEDPVPVQYYLCCAIF